MEGGSSGVFLARFRRDEVCVTMGTSSDDADDDRARLEMEAAVAIVLSSSLSEILRNTLRVRLDELLVVTTGTEGEGERTSGRVIGPFEGLGTITELFLDCLLEELMRSFLLRVRDPDFATLGGASDSGFFLVLNHKKHCHIKFTALTQPWTK